MDEKLKTFLAVAHYGSLSQAARALHISQPAVTLQIQRLEDQYGSELFYRQERGVELTPAGRVLLEYAARIQNLYDQALDDVAAVTGQMQGTLRIGATLTIGEYVLPPVLGRFKARYPEVDVLLEVENTLRVVEGVANGEFECGLVEGPFDNGLIRTEQVTSDELVIVVAPQHRWVAAGEISIPELLTETFILREPGSGTRQVFTDALSKAGADSQALHVLVQVGSTTAIKALVKENLGITAMSLWTVRDELASGVLRRVQVSGLNLQRDFNFIFHKNKRSTRIATRFVQVCRQQVERLSHAAGITHA